MQARDTRLCRDHANAVHERLGTSYNRWVKSVVERSSQAKAPLPMVNGWQYRARKFWGPPWAPGRLTG